MPSNAAVELADYWGGLIVEYCRSVVLLRDDVAFVGVCAREGGGLVVYCY